MKNWSAGVFAPPLNRVNVTTLSLNNIVMITSMVIALLISIQWQKKHKSKCQPNVSIVVTSGGIFIIGLLSMLATFFFSFFLFYISNTNSFLQGVSKKMVQCLFCKFLGNQALDFQIVFFSWKLRSICKFWIQNHFCAILEGWEICKTK